MNEQATLFDFMEDGEQYKPIVSNDWKWTFADYPKKKNGIKVFSCFACGGGSTMGYKLAGCDVLGCCEIDKRMNEIYVANHNPKYNYLMDIRDFNKIPNSDIPKELFDVDILDGSPPCTVFSTAGNREEGWGKKKKFREGQQEQTLDDLSFVFIETVRKLRPKVVIMENVEGLTIGNAWGYVQRIYAEFNASGYSVHHWLLKGEKMGIPQRRHRVFFVAIRNDLQIIPKEIDMSFNYAPILFREIKSPVGDEFTKKDGYYLLLDYATEKDKDMSDVNERITGKKSGFNTLFVRDNMIMPTIRSAGGGDTIRIEEKTRITRQDIINAQTFPQDYYFGTNETKSKVNYICGMSVPPVMIKRIVQRMIDQGVFDYKKEE